MALRLDLVAISLTFSHRPSPVTSLRSSDGGSCRFTITTSTSPSLSKSPKAQPRLQWGALTPGPINSLTDKLLNALASVEQGANKQAINQLTAFINSVESWLKTGKVSSQTASALIAGANAIIAVL